MLILYVFFVKIVMCTDIYHVGSKILLNPDLTADYFGYSLVLMKDKLIVGAPKAMSRTKNIHTGLVFFCPLNELASEVTCRPPAFKDPGNVIKNAQGINTVEDFFVDDMWFGANIAAMSNLTVVCAPRRPSSYPEGKIDLVLNGACYIQSGNDATALMPLKDINRQGFREKSGTKVTLNFYAYGQTGISLKASDKEIIIGAPGILQWTGSLIEYKFISENIRYVSKQPVANPIYTKQLHQDDYFGYSVESGVFEDNGTTLFVVGAPRANMTHGQVFVLKPPNRESQAMNILFSINGPQLGSYFGATLCCMDINNDGKLDILIGAPNYYAYKNGELNPDQGAVFVYLNKGTDENINFENAGHVSGASAINSRFGNAIAELGDVNGDGYSDVAIGAPWENDGKGAVYIYIGSKDRLQKNYAQRIVSESTKGFGMAVSRGVDVDYNNCNDLAIGAYESGTAFIFRCVPTVTVKASINVPNASDLPQNSKNFTAYFCVTGSTIKAWEKIKINVKAKIIVDNEHKRATISGDQTYAIAIKPGFQQCEEYTIIVDQSQDLSRPISLKFQLHVTDDTSDSTTFNRDIGRISDDSSLESALDIQLTRGCGEDLICQPWLELSIAALGSSPYIPGTENKLGAIISLVNKEEPAYGAKVNVTLPRPPKRVPDNCILKDLNMICTAKSPLGRDQSEIWEIELEYTVRSIDMEEITIVAKIVGQMEDHYAGNGTKEMNLQVVPQASFSITGTMSTKYYTMMISRDEFNKGEVMNIDHNYEIRNNGPSDWTQLTASIILPDIVYLHDDITSCSKESSSNLSCAWSIPANNTISVYLPLSLSLEEHSEYLESNPVLNITTTITLINQNVMTNLTSSLILEPKSPIWPMFLGIILGFLILLPMIFGLYKLGFFSREKRDELQQLIKENNEMPGSSGSLSNSVMPLVFGSAVDLTE